jgi:hypothetical protein
MSDDPLNLDPNRQAFFEKELQAWEHTGLVRKVPDLAEELIVTLVVTWPYMELAITDWLLRAAEIPQDIGRILVGRLDTGQKIGKLKELAGHRPNSGLKEEIEGLAQQYKRHSETRNTIIHCVCIGYHKDHPSTLLFLSNKFVKQSDTIMRVDRIKFRAILEATKFALKISGSHFRSNFEELYRKVQLDMHGGLVSHRLPAADGKASSEFQKN